MDLQGVVTVEQAMAFARARLRAVRDVIQDRDRLRAFGDRVLALLPPPEAARR